MGTQDHVRAAEVPAAGRGKDNVNDRRPPLPSWREAGRSVFARSGRLLFGLGMAAALPESAFAARKEKGAEDDKNSDKQERRETRTEEDNQDQGSTSAEKSEKFGKDSADDGRDSKDQESNDRSDKRDRRDDRSEGDDAVDQESEDSVRRSATRKQEAGNSSSDDDGDGGRNGRRTEELAQNRNRDDEPAVDETVDDVPTTPTVPSNPNVPVDTAPDPTDADLFIEANPDVVASVSGGFAFARSGNVIAVSGPDGAQIIQTDGTGEPTDVVTPAPSPDEPSDDGGNNDVDFAS